MTVGQVEGHKPGSLKDEYDMMQAENKLKVKTWEYGRKIQAKDLQGAEEMYFKF
jgi:hypothetical protein